MQKPRNKIKAVLFDLDGTLIDSIPFHIESFVGLFDFFGVKLSHSRVCSVIRLPSREIYEKLEAKKLLGLNRKEFISERQKFYYSLIKGKNLLFPGSFEVVRKLKKKGFLVALVTNSSKKTMMHSTPKKFLSLFDSIVCFDDVKKGKPSPQPFLLAMKKIKVTPFQCIVVGDSVLDVISANRAGIKNVIGVSTGVSSEKELKENGAKVIKKNLIQTLDFIH
ncbi:MAG: HAD family phosphatase [archaeon]|nr:HAD family phosphatase [Candidatus Micrarchaeota archaeon]